MIIKQYGKYTDMVEQFIVNNVCLNHIAISCHKLSTIKNGNITYSNSSLGFNETATYRCDPDFLLINGDTVRTCVGAAGSSGEWTGIAPTCQMQGTN